MSNERDVFAENLVDPNWAPVLGQILVVKSQPCYQHTEFPFAQVTACKKGRKMFKVKMIPAYMKMEKQKKSIIFGTQPIEFTNRIIRPATGDDARDGETFCEQPFDGEYECTFSRAKDNPEWHVKMTKDGKPYGRWLLASYNPEFKYVV